MTNFQDVFLKDHEPGLTIFKFICSDEDIFSITDPNLGQGHH